MFEKRSPRLPENHFGDVILCWQVCKNVFQTLCVLTFFGSFCLAPYFGFVIRSVSVTRIDFSQLGD